MFGFEKLEVWQAAVQFANRIYHLTKPFPADEKFGLTSQLRRAAVSISANIAEGSGRGSPKEFSRFIEIAFGSLMEVISLLKIACSQEFLSNRDYDELYQSAQQIARMLSGLRTSLERRKV